MHADLTSVLQPSTSLPFAMNIEKEENGTLRKIVFSEKEKKNEHIKNLHPIFLKAQGKLVSMT